MILASLKKIDIRATLIYWMFAAIFLLFALLLHDDGFLQSNNLLNIFRQTATITVMAVAMTFVISAAEIDLSIGGVAGLASVVGAIMLRDHGLIQGILGGLAIGFVVGSLNGLLVAHVGIPSFLVTLGMQGVAIGFAALVTNYYPIPILNDTFNAIFGSGTFGWFPGLLLWSFTAVIIGWITLTKTTFGRRVLATGGNRDAAEFNGISTKNVKFKVMLISSVVASIAGLLYAGRLQTGRYEWGAGDELSAIAAVILGGTSLFGGSGRIIGTFFGALLVGLINNGLILAGLPVSQQQIVRGLIIILAVALAKKK
ncbi:AraH Ribose/xylose/arabinose/galactoside ABC-type transport systems, permease components [Candidatus Nanopelagicaceae bacterium]